MPPAPGVVDGPAVVMSTSPANRRNWADRRLSPPASAVGTNTPQASNGTSSNAQMTFPLRFILDLPDWISPRFRHTLAQGAATSQGSRGGEIGSGRSKPEAESETHWWRGSPGRGGARRPYAAP